MYNWHKPVWGLAQLTLGKLMMAPLKVEVDLAGRTCVPWASIPQHVLRREWGPSGGSLEYKLVRRTSVVFLKTLVPRPQLYYLCSLELVSYLPRVYVYCRPWQ